MAKMVNAPQRVTLTLIQQLSSDPNRFHVVVEGYGTPDFTVRAKNPQAAKEALKSYVYNELDGKEEIRDGD